VDAGSEDDGPRPGVFDGPDPDRAARWLDDPPVPAADAG
jgi:hypothetical protein